MRGNKLTTSDVTVVHVERKRWVSFEVELGIHPIDGPRIGIRRGRSIVLSRVDDLNVEGLLN